MVQAIVETNIDQSHCEGGRVSLLTRVNGIMHPITNGMDIQRAADYLVEDTTRLQNELGITVDDVHNIVKLFGYIKDNLMHATVLSASDVKLQRYYDLVLIRQLDKDAVIKIAEYAAKTVETHPGVAKYKAY